MATVQTNKPTRSGRVLKTVGVIAMILVAANVIGFDPIGSLRDRLFGVEQRPVAADSTLLSIRRTTEFRAATGEFSVPVYFGTTQNGTVHAIIPDAFDSNSGVAIYQGSVDAFVDLQKLTTDDLHINRTERTLTIDVPEPRLSSPNVNEEKSKIITQSRGILTRVGEMFNDAPLKDKEALDKTAVKAIGKAARDSDLQETARRNTTEFLTALGKRLGYERVEVKFHGDNNS